MIMSQRKEKAASRAYSKATYSSEPEKKKQLLVPTQRPAIADSRRRQPQRLHILAGQRKKKAASRAYLKARYSIEPGEKSLLHVHITLLKEIPFVHSEGISMHCLNPSLLQGRRKAGC